MIYGYIRVSTCQQSISGNSPDEQREEISRSYPDAEIISEVMSGAKERPLFNELLNKLESGDMIIVTKLDRFCRTTKEGLEYIDGLQNKGVKIHILNMGLIENTPIGRMIVTNLLAYAEFERAMIYERTTAGREYKRRTDENYKEGRKVKKVEGFEKIREMVEQCEMSVNEAIKELGISRRSWYNYCKN